MSSTQISETNPLVEREFTCAECAKPAGKIWIEMRGQTPWLFVSSFTGRFEFRVPRQALSSVEMAIKYGNIGTLFRMDREYAPFFCPDCNACYCQEHWAAWDVTDDDGWFDSARGVCPSGHKRMLHD